MSTLVSLNPSTGVKVGEVSITPTAAIDGVVRRAREAQPDFAALGLEARREQLLRAAAHIEARADEIGALMTREMGKPLREAVGEVREVADMARELDEMVAAFGPETVADERLVSSVGRIKHLGLHSLEPLQLAANHRAEAHLHSIGGQLGDGDAATAT